MSRNPSHAPATGRHLSTGLYVKSKNGIKLRDLAVRRLVRKLRIACPWLEDSDAPACRGWAQLEVLASKVYAELRDHGFLGAEGEPRKLLSEFRQIRQAQLSYERELGMTPAARMTIKASGTRAALDLAAEFAKMDVEQTEVRDE